MGNVQDAEQREQPEVRRHSRADKYTEEEKARALALVGTVRSSIDIIHKYNAHYSQLIKFPVCNIFTRCHTGRLPKSSIRIAAQELLLVG